MQSTQRCQSLLPGVFIPRAGSSHRLGCALALGGDDLSDIELVRSCAASGLVDTTSSITTAYRRFAELSICGISSIITVIGHTRRRVWNNSSWANPERWASSGSVNRLGLSARTILGKSLNRVSYRSRGIILPVLFDFFSRRYAALSRSHSISRSINLLYAEPGKYAKRHPQNGKTEQAVPFVADK